MDLPGGTLSEALTFDPEPGPPTKRGLRWAFFGEQGLRAGWGVVLFVGIYVLLFSVLAWFLRPILQQVAHLKLLSPKVVFILEIAQFAPTIVATAVLAGIERRSPFSYGLQGQKKAGRFLWGLLCGFASLSVLLFALAKAHLLVFDGLQLHGAAILKYAVLWGFYFIVVALFEETTLRGYLQYTLTRGIGFWWGALLLSTMFGLSHTGNPGESPLGIWTAASVGLLLCLSIWYTGSLWWALGFHASWDWAESYFYGTPDSGIMFEGHLFSEHAMGSPLWSGGTTGPEGSVMALMLLVVMAVVMWLWWGRRTVSPFLESGWRPAWSRKTAPLDEA